MTQNILLSYKAAAWKLISSLVLTVLVRHLKMRYFLWGMPISWKSPSVMHSFLPCQVSLTGFTVIFLDKYYSICGSESLHIKSLDEIQRERDLQEQIRQEKRKHFKRLASFQGNFPCSPNSFTISMCLFIFYLVARSSSLMNANCHQSYLTGKLHKHCMCALIAGHSFFELRWNISYLLSNTHRLPTLRLSIHLLINLYLLSHCDNILQTTLLIICWWCNPITNGNIIHPYPKLL